MWRGISIVAVLVSVVLLVAYMKYRESVLGWISAVALLLTALSLAYSVYSDKEDTSSVPVDIHDKSDSINTKIDDNTDIDSEGTSTGINDGGSFISDIDDTTELQLYIKEWKLYEDGYHYEEPTENPGENIVVDFDKGIMGTFEYSRELTREEKDSFTHGGQLYDESGHEVGSGDDLPTYFSSLSGTFILGFPKELPTGNYTYELMHYISDRCLTAKINFTIK